ncbi:MAG: hypothetical protein QNL04_10885 [SAR324 cluster bacterium]|nr:hypothetical protein [SAR324 cluster bacterium]
MNQLDTKTLSMISLAAGIACNHPAMGQCQLKRLRDLGVSEESLAAVVEIARHIRDEAHQELDHKFDQAAELIEPKMPAAKTEAEAHSDTEPEACGCSPTKSGQACC